MSTLLMVVIGEKPLKKKKKEKEETSIKVLSAIAVWTNKAKALLIGWSYLPYASHSR